MDKNVFQARTINNMLIAILALSLTSLVGCGGDDSSSGCGVEEINGKAYEVCRDSDGEVTAQTEIPDDQCVVAFVEQADDGGLVVHCIGGDTLTVPPGEDGTDGKPGVAGQDGSDGNNGSGCEVTMNGNICTMVCENSQESWDCGPGGGTGTNPGGNPEGPLQAAWTSVPSNHYNSGSYCSALSTSNPQALPYTESFPGQAGTYSVTYSDGPLSGTVSVNVGSGNRVLGCICTDQGGCSQFDQFEKALVGLSGETWMRLQFLAEQQVSITFQ